MGPLILFWPNIWEKFEVWRLFTSFFAMGPFSLNFAIHTFILYQNCKRYEVCVSPVHLWSILVVFWTSPFFLASCLFTFLLNYCYIANLKWSPDQFKRFLFQNWKDKSVQHRSRRHKCWFPLDGITLRHPWLFPYCMIIMRSFIDPLKLLTTSWWPLHDLCVILTWSYWTSDLYTTLTRSFHAHRF